MKHRIRQGIAAVALLSCATAAPTATPPVALPDLARAVAAGDALARLDFALVAIDEMAAAYRGEAERIYQERQRQGEAGSRARWSSGTAAYAEQLRAMADRTLTARSVDVLVDAVGDVLLVVDGESVAVAGPRVAEPGLLAGAIVERFCRLQDCLRLVPASAVRGDGEDPGAVTRAEPAPPPRVEWSFSDQGGAVCRTDDGFEFLFRDLAELTTKRAACAMVVAEFRRIARRLAELRTQAVVVDLQRLAIAPLADGAGHRLTVNAHGAYTRLPLPALAQADGLLRAGLLWLEAQRRGEPGHLVLSNAGTTLSPVMRLAAGGTAVR